MSASNVAVSLALSLISLSLSLLVVVVVLLKFIFSVLPPLLLKCDMWYLTIFPVM